MGQRTIGKLAKEAGVHIETIRYYERIGLIQQPKKPSQGWRVYGDHVVDKIKFIKRAQQLGMTLDEVQDLLELRHSREETVCERVRELALAKKQEIEAQIADLTTIRDRLKRLIGATPTTGPASQCALLLCLEDEDCLTAAE